MASRLKSGQSDPTFDPIRSIDPLPDLPYLPDPP